MMSICERPMSKERKSNEIEYEKLQAPDIPARRE
jgi:hypothetical protein